MTKSGGMKPYFADSIIQSQPLLLANRLIVLTYGPVYASPAFCGPALGFLSQILLLPHSMMTSLICVSSMTVMHDPHVRRHIVRPTRNLCTRGSEICTKCGQDPKGPGRRHPGTLGTFPAHGR